MSRYLGDLGIPEAQVNAYGEHLNQGDYLVFVEETADQLSQAEGFLGSRSKIGASTHPRG
uniref:Uncharacterized protein n=1 Tax=Desertifilum tharense IPPAS B-1220 TaxID=1781255 RepID=A0ACD5GST1_9CYAN